MKAEPRFALYYAPARQDPLWDDASIWLGRDCDSNAPRVQPDLPDLAAITADARGYGFHATLKPPMRLAEGVGYDDLLDRVAQIAAGVAPFALPALQVADLHGFLALRETTPCPALQALSDLCVATADDLRAPASEAELAKRRRSRLGAAQDAMLVRWGYPYVFATWFFHMTLTRRLTDDERAVLLPAAQAHFSPALAVPRQVQDICIYTQAQTGTDFVLAERVALRG